MFDDSGDKDGEGQDDGGDHDHDRRDARCDDCDHDDDGDSVLHDIELSINCFLIFGIRHSVRGALRGRCHPNTDDRHRKRHARSSS